MQKTIINRLQITTSITQITTCFHVISTKNFSQNSKKLVYHQILNFKNQQFSNHKLSTCLSSIHWLIKSTLYSINKQFNFKLILNIFNIKCQPTAFSKSFFNFIIKSFAYLSSTKNFKKNQILSLTCLVNCQSSTCKLKKSFASLNKKKFLTFQSTKSIVLSDLKLLRIDNSFKLNSFNQFTTNSIKMIDSNLVNLLKPLNILVLIDTETETSTELLNQTYCDHLFSAIRNFLTPFLGQEFTIYLTSLDELNRRAWFNTTKLLIIVKNNHIDEIPYLDQQKNRIIKEFANQTNNVITFNRKELASLTDIQNLVINADLLKNRIQNKLGKQIVQNNFEIAEQTVHYVYTNDAKQSTKLVSYLEKDYALNVKLCENINDNLANFDLKRYLDHLDLTNRLGRNLIISDVTKSTQPIAEHSPFIESLIVISNQQTEGKGRGKNQWLSPDGSISFTYAVSVPLNSILFKCLPFFQHINALAILLAIKKFSKMDKLDLKIKWPNDIYYKQKHKIVGILTNSQFEGNSAKFFIGTGINLSNDRPTYSLKNIFENEFKDTKFELSKEELIAEILNQVNGLIRLINSQGKEKFIDLYYENWMLTDKIIQLEDGKKAQILGLDEDGFLRVNLVDEGEIVSLLPDGNR